MNRPINTYTNTVRRHSNLFSGAFQLLFWLVFRPSVWEDQIKHLDHSLNKNFLLFEILTRQIWQKKQIWKFAFQAFILLPAYASLATGTFSIVSSTSWENTILGVTFGIPISVVFSIIVSIIFGVAAGTIFGMLASIVIGFLVSSAYSMLIGTLVGIAFGLTFGIVTGVKVDITVGLVVGIAFSIIANMIVGDKVLTGTGMVEDQVTFSLPATVVEGLTCTMGSWINWWRPPIMAALSTPFHAILYRIDKARFGDLFFDESTIFLSENIAFWDEWQYLPIFGLDKHLLLVLEQNFMEGQAALNYLSTSRQRWAAQAAQIELDARQLEQCSNAHKIGEIQQVLTISELASPADTMFRSFNSISVDVNVALRQFSIYNQRLALTDVVNRLNNLIRELTISSDKYAVRFRPIAQRWQNIIDLHIQDLIKESELRQEIDSPYIIGVPVTNRQQLFVGRNDISEKLENLLLDRRSPPLLLYGQRRTGKTSLLNNLGRLLPTSIIPLFVDLQGSISSAKDHTGFLYNLAKAMINSAQRQRNLKLPPLSYETLATEPFTRFDEWLDNLETALAGNTALLALDEFEVLDHVLRIGRFNEADVLGMLRNLIQHRPKFKVLISGSHTLNEYQHWSSYLINAQVIHIGYLKESETRQLIEQPIDNFALRYEPPASQRVIDITRGHPLFVQLLCAEIVALKNDQDPSIRRLATLADVEAAIPAALEHGSMFFSDIEGNQLDTHSLKVLRYFAQQGEGAIISSTDLAAHFTERAEIAESISGSIELLLRRELIETKSSGYSIQLELIRRWFI
jgi:hypothetical protein